MQKKAHRNSEYVRIHAKIVEHFKDKLERIS